MAFRANERQAHLHIRTVARGLSNTMHAQYLPLRHPRTHASSAAGAQQGHGHPIVAMMAAAWQRDECTGRVHSIIDARPCVWGFRFGVVLFFFLVFLWPVLRESESPPRRGVFIQCSLPVFLNSQKSGIQHKNGSKNQKN